MPMNSGPLLQLKKILCRGAQYSPCDRGRIAAKLPILIAVLLLPLIWGQSPSICQDLSTAEKEWLRNHHEMRVGVRTDWPPFETVNDEGKLEGITADYMELLRGRLGIEFRLVSGPVWHELYRRFGKASWTSCLASPGLKSAKSI